MRGANITVLLLGSLLVNACGDQSAEPHSQQDSTVGTDYRPTARLSVTDGSGVVGPFALGTVEKLSIRVDGGDLSPGPHAVRVDVIGPRGLYAQLPATITIGEDRTGSTSAVMQVRGTTIESYRQVGTWRLVATIDGAKLAKTSIDLTP